MAVFGCHQSSALGQTRVLSLGRRTNVRAAGVGEAKRYAGGASPVHPNHRCHPRARRPNFTVVRIGVPDPSASSRPATSIESEPSGLPRERDRFLITVGQWSQRSGNDRTLGGRWLLMANDSYMFESDLLADISMPYSIKRSASCKCIDYSGL